MGRRKRILQLFWTFPEFLPENRVLSTCFQPPNTLVSPELLNGFSELCPILFQIYPNSVDRSDALDIKGHVYYTIANRFNGKLRCC